MFFAACEQARALAKVDDPSEHLGDAEWIRDVVLQSDCRALRRMKREGLLRGSQGFLAILDIFQYQRAKQSYLGVDYRERAAHMREKCPL